VSRAKILVVDDDATHLACAREILEAEGHAVVVHQSAFGATEKVMAERPDLVLLDVNMPALSGEGLVAVMREREATRATRIVLHSSNDEASLQRAAERLGVAGWVSKGDPAELRLAVRRALGEASRDDPRPAAPEAFRLVGVLPADAWERFGARVLPRLAAGAGLRIRLEVSVGAGDDGRLADGVRQELRELGLDGALRLSS
jgi:CheY-like chemotaxis protein